MPPEASWTAIRSPRTSTRGVGFLPAALLPGTPCTGGNFPLPICWVCTPETVYGIAYGFFGLRGMPEPAGELIQGAASLANPGKLSENCRRLLAKRLENCRRTLENCQKTAGGYWQNRWKTAGEPLENCQKTAGGHWQNRWKTAGGHWQNRWKTVGKLPGNWLKTVGKPLENRWKTVVELPGNWLKTAGKPAGKPLVKCW